jgi:serine/threonine protein kinase
VASDWRLFPVVFLPTLSDIFFPHPAVSDRTDNMNRYRELTSLAKIRQAGLDHTIPSREYPMRGSEFLSTHPDRRTDLSRRALELFEELMWDAGIIHADMKPENTVVQADGSDLRLIDFEIVGDRSELPGNRYTNLAKQVLLMFSSEFGVSVADMRSWVRPQTLELMTGMADGIADPMAAWGDLDALLARAANMMQTLPLESRYNANHGLDVEDTAT